MAKRGVKIFALLVLCLYFGAVAHQLVPHSDGHVSGESCSFCFLLTASVIVAITVMLLLAGGYVTAAVSVRAGELEFQPVTRAYLRGPPATLL
jgi:hypothetical protein